MKNIKLTKKGKKFFGGLVAVAFIGTVGLSNLNNNPDGQQVAYIDEYQTVYASDLENETDDLQAYDKDIKAVQAINVTDGAMDSSKGWEVGHVYEDGCVDIVEPIDGEYKFYCEADFK